MHVFMRFARQIPPLSHAIWNDEDFELEAGSRSSFYSGMLDALEDELRYLAHTDTPDYNDGRQCNNNKTELAACLRVNYILQHTEYTTAVMDALPKSDHISTDCTLFNLMEHTGIWPASLRTWTLPPNVGSLSTSSKTHWQQLVQRHLEGNMGQIQNPTLEGVMFRRGVVHVGPQLPWLGFTSR
jgi:hypothetical protein